MAYTRRGRGRGRGRGKMRLLSEKTEEIDKVSSEEPAEQQRESEFPIELLEMIISRLTLRDNIRASAVCKTWLNAANSVRIADKPPLLMISPKYGNLYEFYNPSDRKSYWLDLPELHGSRIRCAKDGWLLLHNPNTHLVFFFFPYTRESIKLPNKDLTTQSISLSAAPTSPNCVVFTMRNYGGIHVAAISTWRPGQTEWTTINYQTGLPFLCDIWNKLVFCNGLFYCYAINCVLGIYNPYTLSWSVQNTSLPGFFNNYLMVEHNGDVFVVCTFFSGYPNIFKLDVTNKMWCKMVTLGGMTIFGNCLSSLARTDLLGKMRNKIYFSKVQYYGKHCISYSLDEGRYYPRNRAYDWTEEDLHETIWIEPPENLSAFH